MAKSPAKTVIGIFWQSQKTGANVSKFTARQQGNGDDETIDDFLGFEPPEVMHEREHFELRQSVSRDGLCTTDQARIPTRHRGLP
jgi:hypothetical protein